MKNTTTAIILSGGKGKRMGTSVSKQYLMLNEKPILYYTLESFNQSNIDNIIIVASQSDISYVQSEIVDKYNISKVQAIIEGGAERYNSVYNGLKYIESNLNVLKKTEYVLIHDGARPFISVEIINKTIDEVDSYKACIVGMPVKDTIKIVDADENVSSTPDRNNLWQIQTPQAFQYRLIMDAYEKVISSCITNITDDSMVLETVSDKKIHLIKGSYENLKITTPEDLEVGKTILKKMKKNQKSC